MRATVFTNAELRSTWHRRRSRRKALLRFVHGLVPLDPASADLLGRAITRLGLSARAYHRILKNALTIADLAGAAMPGQGHVAEAIQYRLLQFEI